MFIEFGKLKIHLLILLIYPVGIVAIRINILYFSNNPNYFLFLFFLSHYLIFFIKLFYIIKSYCFEKRININNNLGLNDNNLLKKPPSFEEDEQEDIENKKSYINFAENEKKKIFKKEKIKTLIFIGIIYFISYAFFYYANLITTTNFYGNISMITEILFFSLFNKIILGKKIYTHHLLSMILISISILGLYILLIIKFLEYESNNLDVLRDIVFPTVLNFIVYLLFCYQLVKAKYYIEKYFISIYEILFSLGSIGLIIILIFELISFPIPCENNVICSDGHFAGIISGFKQFSSSIEYLNSFLVMFLLFMTAFGLWLTVIYLSPSHFLTSDSIITLELNIMLDCFNDYLVLLNNPLFYILSLLTIFGCLVYNEIIILKCFGFNYNTRNEILRRQSSEKIESLIELNEDIISTDSERH